MKRGTPPRRRAPLRAGQPSGRAGAARRAPLRPVSARRSAQNRQRRQVLAEMAGEMPWCQAMHLVPHVMCGGRAVDGHERLTRARGGSITDERNIVLLCRAHHDWVGAHPIDAERLSLLAHSWDNAKDV
ncbi:HNH endonuclease [Frankia sp. AvcI1]|uniref:HNH endonuclease n=1 Tax=Frankia sp. AvcI1 TaxID=573496 RepID=UPI002118D5AF|nr:HNH endonuclease [Frankia sp. AvcI1]